MEINQAQAAPLLSPRYTRIAAVAAGVLGLAGVGLMIWGALGSKSAAAATLHIAWMVLFGLNVIAAVNMLRGCTISQRLLLAFWLAVGIIAIVATITTLLWGEPGWWKAHGFPLIALLIPVLAISIVESALLVAAATDRTRLRYGAMAIVSIAMAAALVLAINLIAQKDPLRKDFETLGQYGLSDRTKRVLQTIDEPVQLTIVYTSADREKRGSDYRDAVVDLAREMKDEFRRHSKQPFNIVNVTSDADRVLVLDRLQKQSATAAPAHKALLDKFVAGSDALLADMAAAQDSWAKLPDDSYLGHWAIPVNVQNILSTDAADLKTASDTVQKKLAGGVPDMADLTKTSSTALKNARDNLQRIAANVESLAKVPEAVKANRDAALKAVNDAHAAVQKMVKVLGGKGTTAPADPGAVLKDFVKAAGDADKALAAAGKALSEVAGKENERLLAQSRLWSRAVEDPRSGMQMRVSMGQVYTLWGRNIQALAQEADAAGASLKPDVAAKYIEQSREMLGEIVEILDAQHKGVNEAVAKLAAVDAESGAILKQAADKKLFDKLLPQIESLVKEFEALPELKSSTLSSDVTGENIVLVELGNKSEAVPFDSVWPSRQRGMAQMMRGEAAEKRVFNGDTAIGSKLLSLSAKKPFATVYLAYVAPPLPPQAQHMRMNPDLSPWQTITTRLRESNFEVKEWNLNEPMPDADPADLDEPATQATQKADKPPKAIVVLSTPPQNRVMPQRFGMPPMMDFTQEHVAKLRREIDSGTPTLVLTQFRAMGMSELLKYVKDEWGASVLTDHIMFVTVPDEAQAGKFRIDIRRIIWMPLNTFAAEPPIGVPLRTQRVLWYGLTPIEKSPVVKKDDQPVRTVKYEPLLSVPKVKNIWALAEQNLEPTIMDLRSAGGNDFVAPREGDIPSPFDVAVALTGSKSGKVESNRMVVAPMGVSLTDPYMLDRIEEKDGRFSDPPKANADFVVNSVYWLIGREQFIGAGPAQIKPVDIKPSTLQVVQPLVVGVLPVLLLAVGGIVLLMRRR